MKTTNSLTKIVATLIIIVAAVNLLSCCKKDTKEVIITHTTTLNTFILPDGIGLVSENNDTVTIVLEPISEITAHSGRASGNVTLIGNSNGFGNLGYGIYWDTIQNPPLSSNNCVLKNFSEDFSFLMYNLESSKKYYVGLFLTQAYDDGTTSSINTITYYREFTTLDE